MGVIIACLKVRFCYNLIVVTITVFLFILGFAALLHGARFLVEGASAIAKRLNISSLVIGLTVVALGTSAPELFVNVLASLEGKADIAVGNVLGSNIVNILLILGTTASVYPLVLKKSSVWREIPFSFLAIAMLVLLISDAAPGSLGLTRIDGLILISFFIFFLYYAFFLNKEKLPIGLEAPQSYSLSHSIIMIFVGFAGLILGGKWIVDGATAIASAFGISEAIIALTIVSFGTSLPEFATSIVAVYKKNADIAVGNIIGSNILNIFLVLGLSSLINPLPFSGDLMPDVAVVLLSTLLLFIFMFIGRRHILERWQGVVFVLLYAGYVLTLAAR